MPRGPQPPRNAIARWTARRPRLSSEEGFTLIELLVVIIILGILAAVVVFAVGGVGDKGRAAADSIDRRTLRTAEEAYFARNGRYGSEAELVGGGFLSEESQTNKVYLSSGSGSCPSGSKCEYTIGAQDESSNLTVYIGRTQALIEPLIDKFTADTGISVTKNFGAGTGDRSSLLATQLVTEGANTPADLFYSQDAANLGKVSRAGLFKQAPSGAAGAVNPAFSSRDNTWVGVSGRARVIAYNPTKITVGALPTSFVDLATNPAFNGRVAFPKTNSSFQNFVAALIALEGNTSVYTPAAATAGITDAATWLSAFAARAPLQQASNGTIATNVATAAGEPSMGLINHYYRFLQPLNNQPNVLDQFLGGGDPLALVNASGVGILKNTDSPGAAEMFVRYLLGTGAQTALSGASVPATATVGATGFFEYPLVAGVPADPALPPLESIASPNKVHNLDLNDLDIDAAIAAIAAAFP